jgi:hypothetical protein
LKAPAITGARRFPGHDTAHGEQIQNPGAAGCRNQSELASSSSPPRALREEQTVLSFDIRYFLFDIRYSKHAGEDDAAQ